MLGRASAKELRRPTPALMGKGHTELDPRAVMEQGGLDRCAFGEARLTPREYLART